MWIHILYTHTRIHPLVGRWHKYITSLYQLDMNIMCRKTLKSNNMLLLTMFFLQQANERASNRFWFMSFVLSARDLKGSFTDNFLLHYHILRYLHSFILSLSRLFSLLSEREENGCAHKGMKQSWFKTIVK